MIRKTTVAAIAAVSMGLSVWAGSAMAGPDIVTGQSYLPECFKPWDAETALFQWKAKDPPYKIALVNGFVGNTWRIQMIKTAKAFVEQPDIAPLDQGVQGRLDPAPTPPHSSAPSRTSSTRAMTPSSPSRSARPASTG